MNILISVLRVVASLPLRVLYVFSDIAYPIVYYLVRYRRGVVRENLANAFPELSEEERRATERRFYRWFCDYVVETLRLLSMSEDEMRERMVIEGFDEVEAELENHPFVFVYLGHYCNWEWISSLQLWAKQERTHTAQIYRPLRSEAFDRLFYVMRTQFGSENIPKNDSLRRILEMRREDHRTVIGFISDQSPSWNAIHHWVTFLHQDTPVFTGTERIARKVDAAIYFANVERTARGRYRMRFELMTRDAKAAPEFGPTEDYMRRLEAMIRRQPYLWLWSHRRWKRTRQEWEQRTQHAEATAKK